VQSEDHAILCLVENQFSKEANMNSYLMASKQIEADVKENQLNIVEGWSTKELERIFDLDQDSALINKVATMDDQIESPNYFLIGGPYPNYSKSKAHGGSHVS
jgi:hypothetical protein